MERNQGSSQDGDAAAAGSPQASSWRAAAAQRAQQVLAWRWLPVALAVLAIVFSLPALKAGLLNDDFMQRAILVGPSPLTDRLAEVGLTPEGSGRLGCVLADLYVAVSPEKNLMPLLEYGALPWWTYEGYRVAFWRPVASFTYWLDYQFFPRSLTLMHLHSVLWLAAVVFLVAVLYRRFIDAAWVAGLAGLFFVLDDSTYFATAWLANRNLLVCLCFALLTLIVYDRWRRDGWKPGAAVAPLCLFASVMSAEAGIAICAYLFAYEVTLGRGRWRQRFAALLPSVVIVLVWRVLYNRLGYGAAGGGFYFDPVREPIGYALVVLKRAPFLLGGQWTTLPPEMHSFLPFGSTMVAWAFMMLAAVATPVVMWPYLKSHARARFWLLGMYLSALPFCATIPMGRSLAFVAIGGFGLIAEFVGSANRRASWMPTQRWRVLPLLWMAPLFVVAHGPLAVLGRVGAPSVTNQMVAEMAEVMQISDEGDLARQDLIVVNAPNPSAFLYEPYLRAEQGRPVPRHVRLLAPGYGEVEVTRTGPQQVTVRSVADSLFDCQRPGRPDFVYFYRYLSDVRGSAHPLEASRRITLDGMVAQVRAVDGQGQAVEVTFDFDVPLDDASLQWLWWDWDHDLYKPFDVPPLGQSRRLVGPF